ncbi:MAG: FecR family protein [Bacillota bacterium]
MKRAKRSALLLSAVSIALSIGPGLYGDAYAETGRPKTVAEIESLEGTVVVLPAGSDLWENAAAGRGLCHGDRVKTGPESWATLALASGDSLMLGPGCEVCFDSLLHLRLFIGRIWAKVRPALGGAENFRVETPSAVVGVRGTRFTVCVKVDLITAVSVASGLVEVAGADGMVLVPAGYATRVRRGLAPAPPQPMDKEERRAWAEGRRRMGGGGEKSGPNQGPPEKGGPPGGGPSKGAGAGNEGGAGDGRDGGGN